MIYDALVEGSFLVSTAGAAFGGSIGFDLNPDFGNGQSARKAGMPGAGADFAIRCRVTQAFGVGAGAPLLQVYAVLSSSGNPNPTPPELVTAGNYVVVGMAGAPTQLAAPDFNLVPGFTAAELGLNDEFYVKCNPWTFPMARGLLGPIDGDDLRYLGLVLNTINHDASSNEFNAGIIQGNIVIASDVSQQADTPAGGRGPIHFPSGVVHK